MIIVLDLDGYIKYFNHEVVKKLGYPPNEVLNEHFSRFRYVSMTRSKFRSLDLLKKIKIRSEWSGKLKLVKNNSDIFWVMATVYPTRNSRGSITDIVISMTDINRQVSYSKKLNIKWKRYQAFIEDQTEMICRFYPDGTISFVNGAYARYFGVSQASINGQKIYAFIPPEEHPKIQKHLTQFTPESPTKEYRHQAYNKNWQLRWQQWVDRAIYDSQGNLIEFQSVGRDITDLMEAIETAEVKDSFIEDLVFNSPISIFAIDIDHRLIIWNKACEELTGVKAQEVLYSDKHKEIFGKETMPDWIVDGKTQEMLAASLCEPSTLSQQGIEREGWYLIRNKIKKYLIVNASPIYDSCGKLISAIAIMQDITNGRKAQEKLHEEFMWTARVQKNLVPGDYQDDIVHIRTIFEPSFYVSGDQLDYFWMEEPGMLRGFVIDIMGQGLHAALQASSLRCLFRTKLETGYSLAESLSIINKQVIHYFEEETIAGAIVFEVDFNSKSLTYCVAGLNEFITYNKHNFTRLKKAGAYLGISDNESFSQYSMKFEKGDSLFFMSDGLLELLSEERYSELVSFENVLAYVQEVVKNGNHDDISAVCVTIK